ncbi:hypothetical protein H5410_004551 [Solanum commersonii]|uniref:Uncharacterized protein n=1 Tax=Solanum commersonii TaxID=4109 RepID=A0A9J6B8B6_SOLCO|nr:hypothetical protein H5410_004551 [Solanum commersonii]
MSSNQGLAGHQHKHKSKGNWIRVDPNSVTPPRMLLPSPSEEFYGPHRFPRHPCAVLYNPQQAMVLQVLCVVGREPISPLHIQDQNLFASRPSQLVENTNTD